VSTLREFKRQALHAIQLTLTHPTSDERLTWQAPLPDDFKTLLVELDDDAKLNGLGDGM
jgi:23S rRNA pseudouridine1911/1915/1917 synthase